ncbi:MAG: hypothetical protein K940chlam9_00621 [Chlamydiae bacterium]|nr:hypothetical protein [Chlamydiota bacterium]
MPYYHRKLEPLLFQSLKQFPVSLITGPRQAGKSTLLKQCLPNYQYVTLDDPALRALALEDPELFLSTHPDPLILDEIQYAPNLLPYIKMRVDVDRGRYGRYVLTGSQSFQLMQGVSETLAGRVAIFHLYPFTWDEVEAVPSHAQEAHDELKLSKRIIEGFYPEFFSNPEINWNLWSSSYVTTYLERDVRNIKAISDLARFQTFINLLAVRAGSLLNLSEVAKECGISQPTAKDWLSILQATYVIYLLRPYHSNKTKRMVKSPKLYFIDTGLLCYLLGIDTPERFLKASERGHIFENLVVVDFLKSQAYSMQKQELFFYRTQAGMEIDLLVDSGRELHGYEIKFTKTPNRRMGEQLAIFQKTHPSAKLKLLCLREPPLPLNEGIEATHFRVL